MIRLHKFLFVGFFLFLILISCQKVTWIPIGIIEDQSGPYKETYRISANGRSLALSEISSFSRQGWKIKIKTSDSMNLPEKSANLMREMYEQVDVFFGISSPESAQVAKYIANFRKKTLISETIEDTVTDHVSSTLIFQQTPINIGKLSVRYFFSNLKKDRMVILFDKSNHSFQSIANGFQTEGNLIGSQVYKESFDSTAQKVDFNRLLARIKTLNPQIIYICTYDSEREEILKLIRNTFTFSSIIFLYRVPNDISLQSNPDFYKNTYCITPFFESKESYITSNFYLNYWKKFNQKPSFYAALGYDEIVLIREMIKRNSNQYDKNLFSHLKGSSWDETQFVTGFRGFSSDGLAKRPIDIVKINEGVVLYHDTFWSEVSLRR